MKIVIDIDEETYKMCKQLLGDADGIERAIANGIPLSKTEESKGKWIPVSEKLPEVNKAVLVWCPEHRNIFCASCDDYGEWNIFGAYHRVHDEVTAWQPLPEPYKEAENDK